LSSAGARSRAHAALSRTLLEQDRVELAADHGTRCETGTNNGLARLHFEAARVAADRGTPAAAAAHHLAASDFAESTEATAHHLVLAGAFLIAAGRIDRALTHLDQATRLDPSDHLRGQVAYLEARARMTNDVDRDIAAEMIAAADLCEGDMTDWAVMMLVDATTCLLMLGSWTEALGVAARAGTLAREVGAHLEALTEMVIAVVAHLAGRVKPDTPDLVRATDHLAGLTDRFHATPQLAWLTGDCLLELGQPEPTLRWAEWIERCANTAGDRAMKVVPPAIRGAVAVHAGQLDGALVASQSAVDRAMACGDQTLAAQTLGLLASVCAARGLFARGFAAGSHQFALSVDTARIPRIESMVALASLELQKGRTESAFAWMRAGREEFGDDDDPALFNRHSVVTDWTVAFAELVVLNRSEQDLERVARTAETARQEGVVSARLWWILALVSPDAAVASSHFERATALLAAVPLSGARLGLSWGTRLADWGRHDEARIRLEHARRQFARLHADGWGQVAERELARLPESPKDQAPIAEAEDVGQSATAGADSRAVVQASAVQDGRPLWQLTLLGSFSVLHEGRPISLPITLAVQALKIVALRKRISVDELVELLWPDADPGIGNRRLRNVLWRNRVSCGDLLYRDGNFICLAIEAVVDADQFRAAAERAIEGASTSMGPDLLREAVSLYQGELLPGDRYVDWPTARRDTLAGLHLSVLDLLVDQAIEKGQTHEALGLLDRLIDADPYEERHYVLAAEIHAASGNTSRALSTLSRVDRTFTDLGLGPSALVDQARRKIAS
jgi:DNA-binding SARP family transcriptional activator